VLHFLDITKTPIRTTNLKACLTGTIRESIRRHDELLRDRSHPFFLSEKDWKTVNKTLPARWEVGIAAGMALPSAEQRHDRAATNWPPRSDPAICR
jgi:hypothetical protein